MKIIDNVNAVLKSTNDLVKAAKEFVVGIKETINDLKYIVVLIVLLYSAALFGCGYGVAKIIGG